MSPKLEASETFWKNFYDLPPPQKEKVRNKWKQFKKNPFDPRLGAHKINRLTALRRRPVVSIPIEGNLRVILEIEDDIIRTLDVGTHDLYK